MGVGWGGGRRGENAGGGGNFLKSSSQAKSGESVGHHQHVSPRQQILQLPYLYFAMASSAISIINMGYLVLNFCVLHFFLDNRMQPLYLILLPYRTLLK